MPHQLVGTAQNADRNLYTNATVWTGTITDTGKYSFRVVLGDGTKNLSGTGGTYLLTLIINGVTYRGGSEEFEIGTGARVEIQTEDFLFPASATVSFKVYSPNASETDVDCTASLFQEVGSSAAALSSVASAVDGLATSVTAIDDEIAAVRAKTDLIVADSGTINITTSTNVVELG